MDRCSKWTCKRQVRKSKRTNAWRT